MQLGMVHPDRLSSEEIKDLWSEVDRDGDGVIDYKDFQAVPCSVA
jgi:Ca2+-binding EF-hand superfamily protein